MILPILLLLFATATLKMQLLDDGFLGFATIVVAGLMTLTVIVNAVLSPWGLDTPAPGQNVRLEYPQSLVGVRVSPRVALLQHDLRAALATGAFDPASDRLLPQPRMFGLAVLADAQVAGPPFFPDQSVPGSEIYYCDGIARALRGGVKRIFILNMQTVPEAIRRCLVQSGAVLAGARRIGVNPLLSVSIAPVVPQERKR